MHCLQSKRMVFASWRERQNRTVCGGNWNKTIVIMMETNIQSIQENIESVRNAIEKAAGLAGRNPAEIELIAVTKERPPVIIKELFECGIRKIGESYLKEALFKIGLLEGYQIEWHMIGTIQTGKANQIVQTFDQVHSVDRLELARELNSKAKKISFKIPVYLECNVSGETTKHGLRAWKADQWEMLLPEIEVEGRTPVLAEYVAKGFTIRRKYKGKMVKARVRKNGSISYKGKVYTSPSVAAAAACKRRTCNGWTFWLYERAPGDWVKLKELRK